MRQPLKRDTHSSILSIGQNVTGENEGVAELYIYARATTAFMVAVLFMPPYRQLE
jgi:hypothetical protein